MPQIKIEVSNFDIREGKRQDCYGCPVARAITGKLRKHVIVEASYVVLVFTSGEIDVSVPTPGRVATFMKKFDGFLEVKPFTFTISMSEEQAKWIFKPKAIQPRKHLRKR